MKLTRFAPLLVIGLTLSLLAPGCRKRPGDVTDIPGAHMLNPQDLPPNPPLAPPDTNAIAGGPQEYPLPDPSLRKDWPRDSEIFKADTAHFDFDSSAVKEADQPKISAVADYLKGKPQTAVEIDGHCDERGTEEYNRSLGERRALALREHLITLGIDPGRIDTVSYGKDRPVDPGHNEAAWRQNRRGEFLIETPPAKPASP
jgi:peptidoglycan-associated lipoprotein